MFSNGGSKVVLTASVTVHVHDTCVLYIILNRHIYLNITLQRMEDHQPHPLLQSSSSIQMTSTTSSSEARTTVQSMEERTWAEDGLAP